jgi:hypothetical protein
MKIPVSNKAARAAWTAQLTNLAEKLNERQAAGGMVPQPAQ